MKKFFAIIYEIFDIIDSANRAAWLTRRGHHAQARAIYHDPRR